MEGPRRDYLGQWHTRSDFCSDGDTDHYQGLDPLREGPDLALIGVLTQAELEITKAIVLTFLD